MTFLKFFLFIMIAAGSSGFQACAEEHKASEDAKQEAELNAQALQALIDAQVSMLIADARGSASFEKAHIKGAVSLSPDLSDEEVAEKAGDKETLIVTYCGGVKCPMSHRLATRLKTMGYKNVIEYPQGMEGWIKNLGPIQGTILDEYGNAEDY